MNRPERAALIADLVDRMRKKGGWSGATHLQKCLFFMQDLLEVPLGYDFTLYKHGPFSFDLRDELTILEIAGLLELKSNPVPYGPSFETTAMSSELRSRVSTPKQYQVQIKYTAENFGRLGVTALERLSTALFVYHEHPDNSIEQLAQQVHELKPHISIERAAVAVEQLMTLEAQAPI